MPLQWRKQMSVNNLIIDQDHRYLLCLINMVEAAHRHPQDDDSLPIAVEQLSHYAREHFDREERIQYAIKYSGYMDHKLAHQRLMDRLEELSQQILAQQQGPDRATETDALMQLLRDWLLDHVLKEDMKMKPHLSLHPVNLMG